MNSERGVSGGTVVLAFLLGGVVGAGIALLTAPQSGRETREKIREATDEAKDKIRSLSDDARQKVREYTEEAKEKIQETYEHGKDAVAEKKNVLTTAIEAGKKAMKEEKERLMAEG